MTDYLQPIHKMTRWKNKFRGHRCFVVGNGPSLAETPLDALATEYSFAVNRIDLIYNQTKWRPTFYSTITCGNSTEGWADSARRIIADGTISFVEYNVMRCFLKWPPPENCTLFNVAYYKEDALTLPVLDWWAYDIAKKPLCGYGHSSQIMLQIALYMGFNPIYLVGCDMDFKEFDYEKDEDPNHFTPKYWGKRTFAGIPIEMNEGYIWRTSLLGMAGHFLARVATERVGTKVYNATIGGKLEIYPRVNIYDILR